MDPTLQDLLKRQQLDGFPDFVGSALSATIPVSERFINELISRRLPPGGRVQGVRITIEDGNQLAAEVRLSGPSFLPAIPVKCSIEDQPLLPDRPTLALRLMAASSLVAMAGSFVTSLSAFMPPGVTMEGDRITIDLRRLLIERGFEAWLNYLTDLRVNTRAGALVIDVRAQVRPRPSA